jgi:excinuclease ABC subunit A
LTDGLVIVGVLNGAERLYSQKLACPNCGRSVPQLEPRSFSFNSPYGACESCTGLGSTWSFDVAKVICDPTKPLLDGALGVGATATSMLEQISQPAPASRLI